MSAQNVIKFQSIKVQDYYLNCLSEGAYNPQDSITLHSTDELAHRRRLRKMANKGFLQRAAMRVSELFSRDRLAS